MIVRPQDYLVRLRPREGTLYASQSRTALATDRDGFISGGADHGLLVHQTRLLSRYGYLINDKPPRPVALSNVEQHTWLGYYVALPPGVEEERDPGRAVRWRSSRSRRSNCASPVRRRRLPRGR